MRLLPTLAVVCLAALLLPGCLGNAVTVSGQGYMSGSKSKSLDCGATGTLAMGSQGTGRLSVTVTDGDDNVVFQSGDYGAGQNGQGQSITGVPGSWTLRVSTGLGYVGQWAVTLSC